MHYAHSNSHELFSAPARYHSEAEVVEQGVDYRRFGHNFMLFTGGVLTGAVLAVTGVLVMQAYNQAMQPIAPASEQQSIVAEPVKDVSTFSVGASVKN